VATYLAFDVTPALLEQAVAAENLRDVHDKASLSRNGKPKRRDVIIGTVAARPEGSRASSNWYFVFVHEQDGEAHVTCWGKRARMGRVAVRRAKSMRVSKRSEQSSWLKSVPR
jgi:hypothetical protein